MFFANCFPSFKCQTNQDDINVYLFILQVREYEADPETNINFYNPRNTQAIG